MKPEEIERLEKENDKLEIKIQGDFDEITHAIYEYVQPKFSLQHGISLEHRYGEVVVLGHGPIGTMDCDVSFYLVDRNICAPYNPDDIWEIERKFDLESTQDVLSLIQEFIDECKTKKLAMEFHGEIYE